MNRRPWRYCKLWALHTYILLSFTCSAQCPPNIGFENGNFDHWDCSIGFIDMSTGVISLDPSAPLDGRHTLIANNYPQRLDPYGGFPVNCPNGSGYSIKLGNNITGRQAERVSYTFTIPADDNNYSIIYDYAVVFQNPNHAEWEQPKFTANVYDVTNDSYIGCSSFSYAASSHLPGFKRAGTDTTVFYKDWTPVTIKLSGYAGRTIRLEFTTNDCTRGGHFGYAYVDVNENCSSPISGNISCLNDSSQTLIAPFGFAAYRWFNSNNFSKVLDSTIRLKFTPPPPDKTVFAVEITPFPGQGCTDTVYTTIQYSPESINLKVPTAPLLACESTGVDLTSGSLIAGSSAGITLSYYLDPSQINYVPTPKFVTTSGTYYIKATNSVGCVAIKPIILKISTYPDFKLSASTKPIIRPTTFDLSSLITGNTNGMVYTYWKDALATIPLTDPGAVNKSGTYYIKGTNEGGCSVVQAITIVVNEPPIVAPNAFSPNGDGVNDVWEIPVLNIYPDCSVEIYNRLGQLIYRSTGTYKPWNGKYNGIDQPVATYYYIIKPDPLLPPVGGSVTIVR